MRQARREKFKVDRVNRREAGDESSVYPRGTERESVHLEKQKEGGTIRTSREGRAQVSSHGSAEVNKGPRRIQPRNDIPLSLDPSQSRTAHPLVPIQTELDSRAVWLEETSILGGCGSACDGLREQLFIWARTTENCVALSIPPKSGVF